MNYILYPFRIAGLALSTLLYGVVSIFGGLLGSEDLFYKLASQWSRTMLFFCGVRLRTHVVGNLPSESVVFVSNHASQLDIPSVMQAVPNTFRIIYKKELNSVPFFGWIMRTSPFIAIDRSNPRDGLKSIEEAAHELQADASVLVFAEGTRSKDGQLASFKRGAFALAVKAEKPLVPVAIRGSNSIVPAGQLFIQGGTIDVVIGDPVYPSYPLGRVEEKQLMTTMHTAVQELMTMPLKD